MRTITTRIRLMTHTEMKQDNINRTAFPVKIPLIIDR